MRLRGGLGCSLVAMIAASHLAGQAVISARSGIINFTEGAVLLNDHPLVPKAGTFASVNDGSILRTEKGRAEILLTPGVFLRIDENSSVRMISSELDNTRIEFLRGAAILDSNGMQPESKPVTLTYKKSQIRFSKPGVYRIDSEPAVFETYTGEAEISSAGQTPKYIDESHQFFFGINVETNKYGEGAIDAFSEWARNRAEAIDADNRAAAQSNADPTLPDPSIAGVVPPVYPTYSVPPAPATVVGPAFVDNTFWNPWGVPPNLFPSPLTVIYVFPRWNERSPYRGIPAPPRTGGIPRLSSTVASGSRSILPVPRSAFGSAGYPVLPPARAAYAHSFPQRPAPLRLTSPVPARNIIPMPVRAPVSRAMVAPARIAPLPMARPSGVAPVRHR